MLNNKISSIKGFNHKASVMILLAFIIILFTPYCTNAQPITLKDLEIKIGGDIHVDSRNFIDYPNPVNNNFILRRARVDFRGTYLKIFEFRFMPNFGLGRAEVEDAYAAISFIPAVKLRGGKFKTPLGLERLQNNSTTFFIEGGLTNNLVPNRDIGIELAGDIAGKVLSYSVGIYNGVVDGASEDGESDLNKEFTARVFLQPFSGDKESFLRGLGIGGAVSTGNQLGTIAAPRLATYRTSSLNTWFRYRDSVIADGDRLRIVPQAYFYAGRFGFLGEYVINNQNVTRNARHEEIKADSWLINFSFLLTDDEASYNGVKPKANFDAETGGWGAFEVAFRINSMTIDDAAFPTFANPNNSAKQVNAWTIGLNWYLNPVFKIMFNYENAAFEAFGTAAALPDEKVFLTRLQAAF